MNFSAVGGPACGGEPEKGVYTLSQMRRVRTEYLAFVCSPSEKTKAFFCYLNIALKKRNVHFAVIIQRDYCKDVKE